SPLAAPLIAGAAQSAMARTFTRPRSSRARLSCVGEEKLLTADLVIRNRLLALRRNEPVDERLAELFLDVRVLGGIDEHYAVLVEQPPVAFDEDREIAAVLEREPRAAIGEDVRVHCCRGVERGTHPLPGVAIPRAPCLVD